MGVVLAFLAAWWLRGLIAIVVLGALAWFFLVPSGTLGKPGPAGTQTQPAAVIGVTQVAPPAGGVPVGATGVLPRVVVTALPAVVQQPTASVPFGLNPQSYVTHPSLYLETGVPCQNQPTSSAFTCDNRDSHTRHWRFELLPGSVAVIGGFIVDGVSNGVYKAVGSGVVDTTVTDGFLAVVENQWANNEWCFRLGQARQFNWAHNTEQPLSGWSSC